jgi:hypothetical protein
MPTSDNFTYMNINGRTERVLCEDDYRKKLLIVARSIGCEREWLQMLDKYDRLLRNARNESEVRAIQAIGIRELSDLLDNGYVGLDGSVLFHDPHQNKTTTIVDDSKVKRHAGIILPPE